MKTLILGDSITEGKLGFDYVHLLKGYNITAKGLGGETLFGLSEWMYEEIAKDNYDQIIIAIGHNDIILPILRTMGRMFKKPYLNLIKRGSIPTESPKEFGLLYRDVIEKVREITTADVAVTTLSLLNEKQDTLPAQRRIEYNREIRKLSDICDVIDIGRTLDLKIQTLETTDYFLMTSGLSFLMDKMKTKDNYGANELAFTRHLYFTFDGIHLNESGAKVYLTMIEEYLTKKDLTSS